MKDPVALADVGPWIDRHATMRAALVGTAQRFGELSIVSENPRLRRGLALLNPGQGLRGRIGLIVVLTFGKRGEFVEIGGEPRSFVGEIHESVFLCFRHSHGGTGCGSTHKPFFASRTRGGPPEGAKTADTERALEKTGKEMMALDGGRLRIRLES